MIWRRLFVLLTVAWMADGCSLFDRCEPWMDPAVKSKVSDELLKKYGVVFDIETVFRPYGSKRVACSGVIPLYTPFDAIGPDGRTYRGDVNLFPPHGVNRFDYRARRLLEPVEAKIRRRVGAAFEDATFIFVVISKGNDWEIPTSVPAAKMSDHIFVFGVTVELPAGASADAKKELRAWIGAEAKRAGVTQPQITVRTKRGAARERTVSSTRS